MQKYLLDTLAEPINMSQCRCVHKDVYDPMSFWTDLCLILMEKDCSKKTCKINFFHSFLIHYFGTSSDFNTQLPENIHDFGPDNVLQLLTEPCSHLLSRSSMIWEMFWWFVVLLSVCCVVTWSAVWTILESYHEFENK